MGAANDRKRATKALTPHVTLCATRGHHELRGGLLELELVPVAVPKAALGRCSDCGSRVELVDAVTIEAARFARVMLDIADCDRGRAKGRAVRRLAELAAAAWSPRVALAAAVGRRSAA